MAVANDDGKKPYTLETEHRDSYIHAIVGGPKVTPQIALDYWLEIADECESTGCSKILLEHNFVEMIPMLEMLEIIGPVGDMLKGRMLAFYDRFGHYDVPEAGKMILRSHDVKMRLFHDLEEAERWLEAN
jgi:hypothetical protein